MDASGTEGGKKYIFKANAVYNFKIKKFEKRIDR